VSSPLNFHLEHYDGPLDLLLDLIRKQEINIYDIPIAQITAQYIEYMQRAVEMNIELSAEFVTLSWRNWIRRMTREKSWLTGCWNTNGSNRRRRCCIRNG
jgi:hypothetical protein